MIQYAQEQARVRPIGHHLGLDKYGYLIQWVGHPGMRWFQVRGTIQALVNWRGYPDIIIIHCSGNDFGRVPMAQLRFDIKQLYDELMLLYPHVKFVWSSVLPRLAWNYCDNFEAMQRSRKRLNRGILAHVLKRGGGAILYPDFEDMNPALYRDNVHLSFIGNELFLLSIQSALEQFLFTSERRYPPHVY